MVTFQIEGVNVVICGFWYYLICSLVISLVMRAILSIFKSYAVACGEADIDDNTDKLKDRLIAYKNNEVYPSGWNCWQRWCRCFLGFGKNTKLDDYWLPTFIGIIELCVYPVLIYVNKYEIIGGWIVIKSAVHWGRWTETRTPFNRYLLANLLVMLASFILSQIFIFSF